MVEEGATTKVQPEELKKNGYAMIKGNPCRLLEVTQLPKATANGNKRVQLIGLNVFTGKKYDDTINCTAGFHGIDVPLTTYAHFSLMDVDKSDGTLSLLTADGEPKEDAMLSRGEDGLGWDAVGEELVKRFDEGESLKVKVLTIMGKDLVVEVNTDTDA